MSISPSEKMGAEQEPLSLEEAYSAKKKLAKETFGAVSARLKKLHQGPYGAIAEYFSDAHMMQLPKPSFGREDVTAVLDELQSIENNILEPYTLELARLNAVIAQSPEPEQEMRSETFAVLKAESMQMPAAVENIVKDGCKTVMINIRAYLGAGGERTAI